MSKPPISFLIRIGTGFLILGLVLFGTSGLLIAGVIGPSNTSGHAVPSGDPTLGILFVLNIVCAALSLFLGIMLRIAGKQKAAAPDKELNALAFVSAILGGFLIPVVLLQWGIMVGNEGVIDTGPYFNQDPLESVHLVSVLIGRVDWEYLAWICPFPIVAIVVGALATAKARKLGGVAVWKARSGLVVGIAALLPILFMIIPTIELIDEVRASREETDIYVFPVDKVNLESASMRIGVGEDGRAECERLKATANRCLCLKKGEGPGEADSLSCVSCGLNLFSDCDGWLDDEVLDKYFSAPRHTRNISEDIEKECDQLTVLTAGWTQGLGVFKVLPDNESTGLQVELTVRSGSQDRCCKPASRYSSPNADGNLRCDFRCFSPNYACAYGLRRLLLDGQPFH
jgi:hypothetical protein